MVLIQTHPALADDGPLALLRQRRAEADAALPKSLAWSSFLFLTAAVSILFAMTVLNGGKLRIDVRPPTEIPPTPEHPFKKYFGNDPFVVVPNLPPDPGKIVPVKDDALPVDEPPPIVEPTHGGVVQPGSGEGEVRDPVGGGGGGGGSEALPVRGEFVYFETPPIAVLKVQPEYPSIAQQAGMEAKVTLQVLVGRDGRVLDAVVVDSAPMFDESALSAVRQWRFRPALSTGHPVAVWITLPVRFTLH